MIQIKIKSDSGFLPEYETEGSAGMDVRAFIKEPIKLKPGERAQVPTGLRIQLQPGYEVQIRARSGLAARNGIGLLNGVGTVDSDYRGEIKILLINHGDEDFIITNGDRIAQMLVASYEKVDWQLSGELEDTERGEGGFGHTGVK